MAGNAFYERHNGMGQAPRIGAILLIPSAMGICYSPLIMPGAASVSGRGRWRRRCKRFAGACGDEEAEPVLVVGWAGALVLPAVEAEAGDPAGGVGGGDGLGEVAGLALLADAVGAAGGRWVRLSGGIR